jgi:subtilisin family serine protease
LGFRSSKGRDQGRQWISQSTLIKSALKNIMVVSFEGLHMTQHAKRIARITAHVALVLKSVVGSITLATMPALGQYESSQAASVKDDFYWLNKPPHVASQTSMYGGMQPKGRAVNLQEVIDVIVEFQDAPLFLAAKQNGGAVTANSLQQRAFQFQSDLARLRAQLPDHLRRALPEPSIKRSFHKIFAGASASIPFILFEKIQKLAYVKRIHFDSPVHISLDESVPLIQADRIWQDLGTQGEGVVVGIIDTGIDYLHPALGGGFGEGFKVIGGYDLINDDPDPMDDNNHGTHVAGIVAADGDSLRGVAPKARLMAFKVLDESGEGTSSITIAGIERAVDPNGDGDFSDKVDIVNMSLGSLGGSADDAKSIAVDNATELGVTFCISAGNQAQFMSIGSPGTARQAITVGATDKQDRLADFSSHGPNPRIYTIKPEIVAPGVSIKSSIRGGGVRRFNGTSMSAPHVTGVCALINALHPEWSPAQIKSAVVTTAKDLGQRVMAQGAGRISALKAAQTAILAVPSHASFGLVDDSQSQWTRSETINVKNLSTAARDFRIAITGLRSGLEIVATPAEFSLAAGQEQSVNLALTVTNTQLPYSFVTYGGAVWLQSQQDTLHVPWATLKARLVTLAFDEPVLNLYLYEERSGRTFALDEATRFDDFTHQLLLELGSYRLLAEVGFFHRKFILKDFTISHSQEFRFTAADVPHLIDLNGANEQGRLLSSLPNTGRSYNGRLMFRFPPVVPLVGTRLLSSILFPSDSVYASDFPADVQIFSGESYHDLNPGGKSYLIQHRPLSGLSGSVQLSNTPSELASQNIQVKFPESQFLTESANPFISFMVSWLERYREPPHPHTFLIGMEAGRQEIQSSEWQGQLFLSPDVDSSIGLSVNFIAPIDTSSPSARSWFFTEPFRRLNDGRVASFLTYSPAPSVYRSSPDETMQFGYAPIYPDLYFESIAANIVAFDLTAFRGALDEKRLHDLVFTDFAVYDRNNVLIASGDILDAQASGCNGGCVRIPVTPGPCRFDIINTGYFIGRTQGRGRYSAQINTTLDDPTPPHVTSLKLKNVQGAPVSHLAEGEQGFLEFSVADYQKPDRRYEPVIPDSTRLYVKHHRLSRWQQLDARILTHDAHMDRGYQPAGYIFSAYLFGISQADSVLIDLKIQSRDYSGNRAEWVLEPAFAVGKNFEEEKPYDEETFLPTRLTLYPNYPNPFNATTIIRYDLPEKTKVSLEIYNVLGERVRKLVDTMEDAGRKSAKWNGLDDAGRMAASGVYFSRLRAGNQTQIKKMILVR